MKLSRLRSTFFLFFTFFLSVANFVTAAETLPEIDAQRFNIKPIQKSTSGKIFLFESNQVIPKTGNLLLVYDHEKPAMAFRVLKNTPSKRQFVAKRIRRYDQTNDLNLNQDYSTLEKIADVLPSPAGSTNTPPPNALKNDTTTPSETNPVVGNVESSTESTNGTTLSTPTDMTPPEAQDSDLDNTSPANLDALDESSNETSEDEEFLDDEPLEYEESSRMNPFNNILSVTAGYFGNSANFSRTPVLNNGFSFSYSRVLFHDVFIKKKSPQDSLAVEFGGIYYRIINKDGGNDLYSMLPFYADLLYQLHLSASFTFTLYGGIQYDYMTSASNPGASIDSLQGLQANFGAGAFYNLGPQWYLRADIGWDRITGGLSIKW